MAWVPHTKAKPSTPYFPAPRTSAPFSADHAGDSALVAFILDRRAWLVAASIADRDPYRPTHTSVSPLLVTHSIPHPPPPSARTTLATAPLWRSSWIAGACSWPRRPGPMWGRTARAGSISCWSTSPRHRSSAARTTTSLRYTRALVSVRGWLLIPGRDVSLTPHSRMPGGHMKLCESLIYDFCSLAAR
jgi:hypothetical protein